MRLADHAASPSPTIHSHTNHSISMMATAASARSPMARSPIPTMASARSPIPPGVPVPILPPHGPGTDVDSNEEAAPDEREEHLGRGVNVHEEDNGEFDLDDSMEYRVGEMDASAVGFS